MKDNIDNFGDYLGQCMDMFFWDYVSYKNTPSVRATKIIKNQGEDILLFGQKNIARYISAQQQNNEIDNDQIYKSYKK